jgi:hypothetical protein|tara:strand:+ start:748 stop:891 length:144 start_codon:yes stop_codon:yes gene_type:complete
LQSRRAQILGAARPFFLGSILGQSTSADVWLVINAFTGMTDNRIFSW